MRETLEVGGLQGRPPDAEEDMATQRSGSRGEVCELSDAPARSSYSFGSISPRRRRVRCPA